jgi:hypothetical protein
MSRFRDLWTSGAYAIKRKEKTDITERDEREAASMLKQLMPEPSQKVYSDLSVKRGQETGRWLKDLVAEAPQASDIFVQGQNNAQDAFEEVRVWVDALFKQFAELAYSFNESAVGTDLAVETERPNVIEKRDDKVWYKPVTRTYQARLATRLWSLGLKADERRIVIFMLPAEMTIGFKTGTFTEDDAPPFLVAEHGPQKNQWLIQGEDVPLSKIAPLAKELFGDLVRIASGKMSESELFNHHAGAPVLGENVAVGFDAKADLKPNAALDAQHPAARYNIDDLTVSDACDVVDKVVDKELKRLYAGATKFGPGTPESEQTRKKISELENFRMKVVDAFVDFTHQHHTNEATKELAGKKK